MKNDAKAMIIAGVVLFIMWVLGSGIIQLGKTLGF